MDKNIVFGLYYTLDKSKRLAKTEANILLFFAIHFDEMQYRDTWGDDSLDDRRFLAPVRQKPEYAIILERYGLGLFVNTYDGEACSVFVVSEAESQTYYWETPDGYEWDEHDERELSYRRCRSTDEGAIMRTSVHCDYIAHDMPSYCIEELHQAFEALTFTMPDDIYDCVNNRVKKLNVIYKEYGEES